MQAPRTVDKDVDRLERELGQAKKALARVKSCMYFVRENWIDLVEMKTAWEKGDDVYAGQVWNELDYKAQSALILAPTKGGIFTTDQRNRIHVYWEVTIDDIEGRAGL